MLFYLREFVREAENTPRGWQGGVPAPAGCISHQAVPPGGAAPGAGRVRTGPIQNARAARRYIDEHFTEPLSLDMLAEVVHLNKYHLSHTFQREYGISPISYLITRRIREGRHMLENTSYSLSQIAHSIGFSSPSYFRRASVRPRV